MAAKKAIRRQRRRLVLKKLTKKQRCKILRRKVLYLRRKNVICRRIIKKEFSDLKEYLNQNKEDLEDLWKKDLHIW